ncbi:hypothetical protein JW921_05855, partial [Candidatus Fermentibacterales bacterium]|nr:hypothetical protein [Candidatus Fermentibacterales bacterium]
MRAAVLLVSLLMVPAVIASVGSPREAADLVVTELLSGSYEGKSVLSLPSGVTEGQLVDSWHVQVEAPFDGFLVLVDDIALANWEHPCRWVFVSFAGDMEVVRMQTPPVALPRMTVEYSDLPVPGQASVQSFLEWFEANPRAGNDPAHTFALIISGGASQGNNHIRYYGDVQFIFTTLQGDYGYTDENIVVCFADGTNPAPDQSGGLNSNPDLDNDGDTDFDYDATLAGVTSGYNDILGMVSNDDHLLIFTTDHGGNGKLGSDIPPEVYLNLWNWEQLNDDVFDGWLDNIDAASIHVVMEQCYSGGFLEETVPTTGGQPRTFSSAASGYQSSWAGATYPEYDEWAYWWTGAMHGSVPPGGSYPGGPLPYDPDANNDGYVDYKEAWDCAYDWDSCCPGQENPQWGDDPDSCGSDYYLGGLIPTSTADQGYVVPGPFSAGVEVNPFSGTASLRVSLASGSRVVVSFFDLTGRMVD